ncbi:DUF892 family protein [Pedobacter xixiisoli]|uniref:Uncharacterized protein n=1 Tax=Pedobacter xixiisoli TaxID=1476464 RepID=A0A285ZSF3_9SPHI|nr:DUF892 family protein [Pedobacter xixiisoli]SOD12576.1 protein of unknown function [Pedobacter xixiisoli]
MKTLEPSFDNVLQQILHELEMLEKLSKKNYLRIRELAHAPELAKAMHSDQTGVLDHINRLKLIGIELKIKSEKSTASSAENISMGSNKKKGAERDLWMISKVQQLIHRKIALYKIAHCISLNQVLVHAPILLEQTTRENEATSTWLDRIIQRILSGEIIIPESKI